MLLVAIGIIILALISNAIYRSYRDGEFEISTDNNYIMERIWGFIFGFVIVGLTISPVITVAAVCIIVLIYFPIRNRLRNRQAENDARRRRKAALLRANLFLSPYKDIWSNLTLSNGKCSLKLGAGGKTIYGREILKDDFLPVRSFKVTKSPVYDYNNLWDLFCISFAFNTSYDGLIELCETYKLTIVQKEEPPKLKKVEPVVLHHKTDVNNASEAELTALPGISIVMSKKIVKKREEIEGFKTLEELFAFLKLKPHMQEQLKDRIIITKMKGTIIIKRNQERSVDL